jgi:phosphate-selective porin
MKMKTLYTTLLGLAFLLLGSGALKAQEPVMAPPPENEDTLSNVIRILQSDVAVLKRVKFSGYVQAQYQQIDSAGAKSVAGGDFPVGVNKRFKVRRGEFKTMYDNGKTQIVANIDITQNGVSIKDCYGKFTEQWLQTFSVTAGIFNRPFGWEVPTSSSAIGSPERSRVNQMLFPGERDLGVMLTVQLPVTSPLRPLKLEAGLFNGNGNTSKEDYDFQKDFISHLTWVKSTKNEKISYGLGVSLYNGGVQNTNKFVYDNLITLGTDSVKWVVDSTASNKGAISKRQYIGFDGQFSMTSIIGITTVRVEYVTGTQPGTSSDTKSPNGQTAPPAAADTYVRKMDGLTFFFSQNIGSTKNQVIFKYDWYDPNTQVEGLEIGKSGSKLTAADIKYTTMGFGWIYNWDNNVKIIAYYDLVKNEKTSLNGYKNDLLDNVFTARIQYKF